MAGVMVTLRMDAGLVALVDVARGGASRSAFVRGAVERVLAGEHGWVEVPVDAPEAPIPFVPGLKAPGRAPHLPTCRCGVCKPS